MQTPVRFLCIVGLCAVVLSTAAITQTTASLGPLEAFPQQQVTLHAGEFATRYDLNRAYLMSLTNDNLLQNHYLEAGITNIRLREKARWTPWVNRPDGADMHWGWESPTSQLRGHFLGHWLSAAAHCYASTGDTELKAKADVIVSELARCQRENGGEWAAGIPEKYLDWIARGKGVWVPQYTIHKTFMGLIDMYTYAGNEQALEIADRFADWFHRWSAQFSREEFDDILDLETGGMLEAWADLYGITGDAKYLDLIERYDRDRLFGRLLDGEDPLTNHHANTTIPEAHGAARAYEVTGDRRWRDIAQAYWDCAVTDRGYFCTGGQTSGEVWLPPFELSARMTETNQEHCTVYNMIRLADFLFRWSGDIAYTDYIERNIMNGILAQQNTQTGLISYFIPMHAGAHKIWGSPTYDFWCCHGSLVQANAQHDRFIYYRSADGIAVTQYIPSELRWEQNGTDITIRQRTISGTSPSQAVDDPDGPLHRPMRDVIEFTVSSSSPEQFALHLRLPWWIAGDVTVTVNGEETTIKKGASSFYTIERTWQNDRVTIVLPKALTTCPLPDAPDMMAFMEGPVVLAGLCDGERTLTGDPDKPETMLTPDNERLWSNWNGWYRVKNQGETIFFRPLHEITDEQYTLYFQVKKK